MRSVYAENCSKNAKTLRAERVKGSSYEVRGYDHSTVFCSLQRLHLEMPVLIFLTVLATKQIHNARRFS